MCKKAKVINPVLKNMLSPMLYDTAYIIRGSSNITHLIHSKSTIRNCLYPHVKDEILGIRLCLKKLK